MVNSQRSLAAVIMTFLGIKVIVFVQNFPGVQRQRLLCSSSLIAIIQNDVKCLHPTSHGPHSEDFLYPFLPFSLPPSVPLFLATHDPCHVALRLPLLRMYGNRRENRKGIGVVLHFKPRMKPNNSPGHSQLVHLPTANSPTSSLMFTCKCFLGVSLLWLIFSFHFNMAEGETE